MAASGTPVIAPSTILRHAAAIYSPMTMLAGMQLDLFTPLKVRPMTCAEIAVASGVQPEKLRPLLYALVVAELLTVREDRFSNTPEADAYLVSGRPASLRGRHETFSDIWHALLKTAATIRANAPPARHDFHVMSEDEMGAFFRGQHPNAMAAGEYLAKLRDFSRFRNMLDAGGGSGGVAIGACRVCPALTVTVAELPKVRPVTQKFLEEALVGDRVSTIAADLVAAPPDGSYDVAVVRNIVPVLSLQDSEAVIRNVVQSLTPGGTILVVGSMLDDSRLSPPDLVGQNLVHLSLYDDGLIYTEGEYRSLLETAGVIDIKVQHGSTAAMPGGTAIISARKAASADASDKRDWPRTSVSTATADGQQEAGQSRRCRTALGRRHVLPSNGRGPWPCVAATALARLPDHAASRLASASINAM